MEVWKLFGQYMGNGLLVMLFLLSVLYLLWQEKRRSVRVMFVYAPIAVLLLFFQPAFEKVLYAFLGTEIYYRILWLIPYTIVIAYTVVSVYEQLKGRKKMFFALAAAVLLMASGNYIYSSPLFQKAQNCYHMPQSVVDICDAIEIPGREVMAVFPAELLQYVRQYSPLVRMPYGREMLVDRWNFQDDLYELMEQDSIPAKELATQARSRMCHFIILPKEKEIEGALSDYDYIEYGRMDGYIVYKDSTVRLEIPVFD